MRKIKKKDMGSLIQALIPTCEIFAPIVTGSAVEFTRINRADEICMAFANARVPPKKVFLPQSESMFRYEQNEKGFQIESTEAVDKRRILFGMRPCDVQAVTLLDRVFDGNAYKDPYYVNKREKTVIIAIGCNQPAPTCFCSSMDSGPFSRKGADIFLTDLGSAYVIEGLTPKGDQIMEAARVTDVSPDDRERAEQIACQALKDVGASVERMGLAAQLDRIADSDFWGRVQETCIGCGICTFLCPTCYCFDIVDEGREAKGRRVRHWDSCLFPLYTQEASGHNPRPTGAQRMRQRIMHKFNYFVKSFGQTACVGCGRCVIYCPVNLDIRRVIEEIRLQRPRIRDH
jgi:ferredoxin